MWYKTPLNKLSLWHHRIWNPVLVYLNHHLAILCIRGCIISVWGVIFGAVICTDKGLYLFLSPCGSCVTRPFGYASKCPSRPLTFPLASRLWMIGQLFLHSLHKRSCIIHFAKIMAPEVMASPLSSIRLSPTHVKRLQTLLPNKYVWGWKGEKYNTNIIGLAKVVSCKEQFSLRKSFCFYWLMSEHRCMTFVGIFKSDIDIKRISVSRVLLVLPNVSKFMGFSFCSALAVWQR